MSREWVRPSEMRKPDCAPMVESILPSPLKVILVENSAPNVQNFKVFPPKPLKVLTGAPFTNICQPSFQLAPVLVTRTLRCCLIASILAVTRSPISSDAAERTLCSASIPVKLGTAIAARILTIPTTTIISISVKPSDLSCWPPQLTIGFNFRPSACHPHRERHWH